MNIRYLTLVVSGLGSVTPALAQVEVSVGDARTQVLQALGQPTGEGRFDHLHLLSYPRGTVMLENDRVISVTWKDRAVWEQEQQAKREAAAQRAQQAHQALQDLLSRPGFLHASLEWRIQHWHALRTAYPELALPEEYRRDVEAWQRRQAEQARMDELERRTVQAEWAAEQARRDAEQARLQAEAARRDAASGSSYRSTWSRDVYLPPVVVSGGGYCKPPHHGHPPAHVSSYSGGRSGGVTKSSCSLSARVKMGRVTLSGMSSSIPIAGK